jgi:hypothetical protein
MNYQDLALELVEMAQIDGAQLTEKGLNQLHGDLAELVHLEEEQTSGFDPHTDEGRTGLGFLHFKEQRFYSVKLGNAHRDRLGSLGIGGALLSSSTGIAKLVTTGALAGWAGGAALAAILLALVGRAKPFVATFGLDEATTLDLAWRHSRIEYGFRLVNLADLIGNIGEVEMIYRNAGFNPAKLNNALNKLIALGMVVEAGAERYQLVERIVVSGANQLTIRQA